jgi:hypothetical protein
VLLRLNLVLRRRERLGVLVDLRLNLVDLRLNLVDRRITGAAAAAAASAAAAAAAAAAAGTAAAAAAVWFGSAGELPKMEVELPIMGGSCRWLTVVERMRRWSATWHPERAQPTDET